MIFGLRYGRWLMLSLILGVAALQVTAVAQPKGYNYDEAKVPKFTLPDPLIDSQGNAVRDAKAWEARRREILQLFENEVYGRSPQRPAKVHFRVLSEERVFDGAAIRKQVAIRLGPEDQGPEMELLIYVPTKISQPVPAFLGLNFNGNQTIHSDPGIRVTKSWVRSGGGTKKNQATEASRGRSASRWQVEKVLQSGYALASVYYGDIDPDFHDGFKNGVHPFYYRAGQEKPAADEWGSVAAWAWGLSRCLDYFHQDSATAKQIDASRVAVLGHSRLGKTALWAGAADPRFALVISNDSGCGGAALSRRRFGETVKRINTSFPHWFCGNFKKYNDNENELPVDQHMLIAIIAPRPVYVASAADDLWADPSGEFLSAWHASPVYRLLGKQGLPGSAKPPAVDQPRQGTIGYHRRTGKHDVTAYDWQQYLKFADRHLKKR